MERAIAGGSSGRTGGTEKCAGDANGACDCGAKDGTGPLCIDGGMPPIAGTGPDRMAGGRLAPGARPMGGCERETMGAEVTGEKLCGALGAGMGAE